MSVYFDILILLIGIAEVCMGIFGLIHVNRILRGRFGVFRILVCVLMLLVVLKGFTCIGYVVAPILRLLAVAVWHHLYTTSLKGFICLMAGLSALIGACLAPIAVAYAFDYGDFCGVFRIRALRITVNVIEVASVLCLSSMVLYLTT